MKINNRDLKHAYRSIIADRRRESRTSCPSTEEMWTLLRDKRRRKRKSRLIDHITDCSTCHEEFTALLEMNRAVKGLMENVHASGQASPGAVRALPNWRFAAVVFALIAVIGLAVISTARMGLLRRPYERGRQSGRIHLLAPASHRSVRAPVRFEWVALPHADCYMIEIFDSSLRPIWKSAFLTQNWCHIPASVETTLTRDVAYFWLLTAFQQDGTKTESSLEEFRLIN